MATISDIKSWTVTDESIIGNVGDTNLTIITTAFHEVETVEVVAPAQVAVIDIGVVGLGNSGGGSGAVDSVNGQSGVVVLDQDDIADGTTHKQYSATEKTKLAGVATGATANDTDANLKNRANHTGSQAISTVTGLQTAIDGKAASSHTHAESDVTGLTAALAAKADDSHTHVVADITDFDTEVDSRIEAVIGTAPAALDTLGELSDALGDDADFAGTMTTALAGKASSTHTHAQSDITNLTSDLAAKAPLESPAFTGTPTGITKSHVGLGNVDNTADTAKPVSSAQQTALDGKQNLDSDLTSIAGLSPSNDDIIQRKAGAWANRTIAQLKTDLAIGQSDVSGLATLLALGFYYADGTTSTNARPSVPGKVLWVGGTTQPVNMATGDLWVKA